MTIENTTHPRGLDRKINTSLLGAAAVIASASAWGSGIFITIIVNESGASSIGLAFCGLIAVSTFGAFSLLGKRLSEIQIFGAVLVIAGVVWVPVPLYGLSIMCPPG